MELWDASPINVMTDYKEVYYVDDAGVGISYKGACLLPIAEKLKNPREFAAFVKGYGGKKSIRFFTHNYELLLRMYFMVGITYARMKRGDAKVKKYLIPLKGLLIKGKVPRGFNWAARQHLHDNT
ncbi:hypothetical protein HY489_00470 [Candidatus Woesearchaeota archaeon]|nr:hypothetical protein [Candidatus Woesearchaeota archaeon]